MWVIICTEPNPLEDGILFWSNEWGWITDDLSSISLFTDEQKQKFNLPQYGQWELADKYGIK